MKKENLRPSNMSLSYEEMLLNEPNNRRYQRVVTLIIVALLIWSSLSLQFAGFEEGAMVIAKNIIQGILSPDLEFLLDFKSEQGVPFLLLETMAIAFLGTIFGSLMAIPIAFLMATNMVHPWVARIMRLVLVAIRTIPPMIYGLMFVAVSGQGPMTGVLTMALTSIGMVSKLYVDVIEDLDQGVLESMTSMGCNLWEKIRFGVIPQLLAAFLSVTIYRFDMNLRDATTLGLVGAGGIGAPLIFAMNAYKWQEVGSILIGLMILILIVEIVSSRLRDRLIKG